MGYEGLVAQPSGSSFSISHSTIDFNVCCFSKRNSFFGVVVVFQLVQYCNSNLTLEWPFEVVIKLSSHQNGGEYQSSHSILYCSKFVMVGSVGSTPGADSDSTVMTQKRYEGKGGNA